ncbi:hypothetical protein DL93DRAFT_2164058 [Clavulina sp. PMI_390]|nr:hypothetical protein DL93DRAFT_2164058 [Clavulina sp. PMI_390]
MLIEQSQLRAVQVAHEALLKSISLTLQSPRFTQLRHAWSTFDIPERKRAIGSINDLTAQVLECRQQVESLQSTLDEIRTLCVSAEGALGMCLNPVMALPAELIQHIARFVVEAPRKTKQIVTLAQVSRMWRSVIFDMSELFISPDWTWAGKILEPWIARARGRLLEAHVIIRDESKVALTSLSPYLSRLQRLYLVSEDADALHQAGWQELILQHSMPVVTNIHLRGTVNKRLSIDPSKTPLLHTLHSVATPTAFASGENREADLRLQNLGWRVHSNEDFQRLTEAVALQNIDFHLTLFAHQRSPLPDAFVLERRRPDLWSHLSSLRIHGFVGRDAEFFGTLVQHLDAPNLRSVELVDITISVLKNNLNDWGSILHANQPSVTNAGIERLLIASVDTKGAMKILLQPFIDDDLRDDMKLAAYNIREFAFYDFDKSSPNVWEMHMESLNTFVQARKGALKRLVLPHSVQPTSDKITRSEESTTSYGRLTSAEVSALYEQGGLEEISYCYTLDHHGFEGPYPRY